MPGLLSASDRGIERLRPTGLSRAARNVSNRFYACLKSFDVYHLMSILSRRGGTEAEQARFYFHREMNAMKDGLRLQHLDLVFFLNKKKKGKR